MIKQSKLKARAMCLYSNAMYMLKYSICVALTDSHSDLYISNGTNLYLMGKLEYQKNKNNKQSIE